MQNVGTVFAIKRAIIDGEPLIERVVTLTGAAIQNPGNYWVRLGTQLISYYNKLVWCHNQNRWLLWEGH